MISVSICTEKLSQNLSQGIHTSLIISELLSIDRRKTDPSPPCQDGLVCSVTGVNTNIIARQTWERKLTGKNTEACLWVYWVESGGPNTWARLLYLAGTWWVWKQRCAWLHDAESAKSDCYLLPSLVSSPWLHNALKKTMMLTETQPSAEERMWVKNIFAMPCLAWWMTVHILVVLEDPRIPPL